MQRWKISLYNIAFALNCLLVFLLLFESRLQVPSWLQVAGRMHPLVLHFPIVLLIVAIVWELFIASRSTNNAMMQQFGDGLLLAVSLTAVFTSLMGLFLSKEDGYTADTVTIHKWGGVTVSLLTLAWYHFRNNIRKSKISSAFVTALSALAIIITGHEGANITHGENFLLAPVFQPEAPKPVLLEDAVVYTHMVKPILDAKCVSCHNQQKAKGELVMETPALLLKGGKSGLLWDTAVKNFGRMFDRIHLPMDQKKHMPPKGKPQLSDEEIDILYQWVKHGADFKVKVMDLPEKDSLRLLAAGIFTTIETDDYTFEAADENKVKALTTNYRLVNPLAIGSPALGVEFYQASQFKPEQLKELLAVKDQIVSLNLNKMPIRDEDLKTIAQFKNLRRLNISFSDITGATLGELAKLPELKQLSLSGTKVTAKDLQALTGCKNLSAIYAWNTGIKEEEYQALSKGFKNVRIEKGFRGDTIVTKLNAPIVENEEDILTENVPLKLKHYVRGVVIRYTLDGSEPDSLKSPEYKGNVMLDRNLILRAKAFKPGWISSDVVTRNFYKAGVKADSALLVTAPDPSYRGDGAKTLINAEKGDMNFRSGKWLGYKEKPLEALIFFNKATPVSSVTVSTLIDIGSFIMPASSIEVWGGTDKSNLKLLQKMQPPQPSMSKPGWIEGFNVQFPQTNLSVVKVVVKPVPKLPVWHQGKGEKGWTFVDEIFVN